MTLSAAHIQGRYIQKLRHQFMQAGDHAPSDVRDDNLQLSGQQNERCHTVTPDICAPLTPAALEWLQSSEPLLNHATSAAAGSGKVSIMPC